MNDNKAPLLELRDYSLSIKEKKQKVPLLKGLSFALFPGESLCIVGESGCGKTLTARSIMGLLLDQPNFSVDEGAILYKGQDILDMGPDELRQVRGKEMAMIFQEPMTALNPVFTIGEQIKEMFTEHQGIRGKEAHKKAISLLEQVGIPEPGYRVHSYPHELSGGMRQRAMIAMAIALNPALLIADEPTTALDVTVQAQILRLLKRLCTEMSMALLLITHDLGIVSEIGQRVIIMYSGMIVEEAQAMDLFSSPLHPYTKGLLESIPRIEKTRQRRLEPIPGNVPPLTAPPKGCPFHPRCRDQLSQCNKRLPALKSYGSGTRRVRCFLYE